MSVCSVPSSQSWDEWVTPDSGRAEVPLDSNSDECYLAGASLDFSSTKPAVISTLAILTCIHVHG